MNRTVIGWAIFFLLFAVALIVSPIPLDGAEALTPMSEIGVFFLPVAIVVAIAGGLSPDPSRLTVGGALGNPDEAPTAPVDRRAMGPAGAGRTLSPKEPLNCRRCYTLVPWNELFCPRCATARSCRVCATPLRFAGPTIECARCGRAELYCRCVPKPRTATVSEHTRRRAVR